MSRGQWSPWHAASVYRVQHFPRNSSSLWASLPCSTSPVFVSRRPPLCCEHTRRHLLKSLSLSATTLRLPLARRSSDNSVSLLVPTGKEGARHQRMEQSKRVIRLSEWIRVPPAISSAFRASLLPPRNGISNDIAGKWQAGEEHIDLACQLEQGGCPSRAPYLQRLLCLRIDIIHREIIARL